METIDYLPFVKAYPALSKTYGEVSCIAGVRIADPGAPEWIRLYPVPFRALDDAQQFRKYQPMRVRVAAHGGDRRRETRRPDRDSIELLGDPIPPTDGWRMRRRFVEPLMVGSMCEILRRQREDGTSLGVFRPKRVIDSRQNRPTGSAAPPLAPASPVRRARRARTPRLRSTPRRSTHG